MWDEGPADQQKKRERLFGAALVLRGEEGEEGRKERKKGETLLFLEEKKQKNFSDGAGKRERRERADAFLWGAQKGRENPSFLERKEAKEL